MCYCDARSFTAQRCVAQCAALYSPPRNFSVREQQNNQCYNDLKRYRRCARYTILFHTFNFCQMFVCALSVAGSPSIAIAKARQQVYNAARCTAACCCWWSVDGNHPRVDRRESRTLTLQKKKEHEAAKRSAQKAEGGAAYEHVIVSCVAQCAALYNSAVESIHVVDKSGHECQNLSIEHGFIAIKQWPV